MTVPTLRRALEPTRRQSWHELCSGSARTTAYDVDRGADLNGKRRVHLDLYLEELETIGAERTLVFGLREDGD